MDTTCPKCKREGIASWHLCKEDGIRNDAFKEAAAIARKGIDPEFIAKEIEKLIK